VQFEQAAIIPAADRNELPLRIVGCRTVSSTVDGRLADDNRHNIRQRQSLA
jgi:hypothetical protein